MIASQVLVRTVWALVAVLILAIAFEAGVQISRSSRPPTSVATPPEAEWAGEPAVWVQVGDKLQLGDREVEVNIRPQAARVVGVEIGFRADGVVVWRKKQ